MAGGPRRYSPPRGRPAHPAHRPGARLCRQRSPRRGPAGGAASSQCDSMQISPTWDQETTINNKTIVTGIGDLRLDDVTLTAYGTSYNALVATAAPEFTVKALLEFGNKVTEGRVVASVTVPWRKIVGLIQTEPATIYDIDGFKWEEIIAGAYEE